MTNTNKLEAIPTIMLTSDFRSLIVPECIEHVREFLVTASPISISREKPRQQIRLITGRCWHGHCQEEAQNKKGLIRVNRVMLGDCGEWKLWGRHPLTSN